MPKHGPADARGSGGGDAGPERLERRRRGTGSGSRRWMAILHAPRRRPSYPPLLMVKVTVLQLDRLKRAGLGRAYDQRFRAIDGLPEGTRRADAGLMDAGSALAAGRGAHRRRRGRSRGGAPVHGAGCTGRARRLRPDAGAGMSGRSMVTGRMNPQWLRAGARPRKHHAIGSSSATLPSSGYQRGVPRLRGAACKADTLASSSAGEGVAVPVRVVGHSESVIPAKAGIHLRPTDERTEGAATTSAGDGTHAAPQY